MSQYRSRKEQNSSCIPADGVYETPTCNRHGSLSRNSTTAGRSVRQHSSYFDKDLVSMYHITAATLATRLICCLQVYRSGTADCVLA